jgi:hypothetical protein
VIEIQQTDSIGVVSSMNVEPGEVFEIFADRQTLEQIASPLLHALKALGAAQVVFTATDAAAGESTEVHNWRRYDEQPALPAATEGA